MPRNDPDRSWNFNWQMAYDVAPPVTLPKGSRNTMGAHFDHSAGNPGNPNSPPAEVRWGKQSITETCVGFSA